MYLVFDKRDEQYYDGAGGYEKDLVFATDHLNIEEIKNVLIETRDSNRWHNTPVIEEWEGKNSKDITEDVLEAIRKDALEKNNGKYPYKVVLAPNAESAVKYLESENPPPDITVEAEYGNTTISGETMTLAHHGNNYSNKNYAAEMAPCVALKAKRYMYLGEPLTFMVSHIDADTVFGIALVTKQLPEASEQFRKDIAYIDVNGPHNLYQLSHDSQDKLNAIYAWNENTNRTRFTELTDVTDKINEYIETARAVLNEKHPLHDQLIENGRKWAEEKSKAAEEHCVFENEKVRVFVTDGPSFCASYYSPSQDTAVPATVQLNKKFGSVTLGFADGGEERNAVNIMQELFGEGAGGKARIAGSPRGETMTEEDLREVVSKITGIEKEQIQFKNNNSVKESVREKLKNITPNFASGPEEPEKTNETK